MAEVYQSSRLTSGNLLFPDSISVETDGVHYNKRRLIGGDEEIINYRQLSSIKISNGICCANLLIETSGGSEPIVMNGLGKGDARGIRDSIKQMQSKLS